MGYYRIAKRFTFDAAHQLHGLPDGHKCGRLHGHTYTVEVELGAVELDDVGFVRDFGDLNVIRAWIDHELDHRNLNDVWPDMNTTAEKIARAIFVRWTDEFPELSRVTVWETPKAWASYEQ